MSSLVSIACVMVNAQIGGFVVRLSDALMQFADASRDAREAGLSFNAANLLKKNSYAYYHLVSIRVEKALLREVAMTQHASMPVAPAGDNVLSLVSYEDVDKALLLDKIGNPIAVANTAEYAALGTRLSHLLGIDHLSTPHNPFRPEIFIQAMYEAWREFDPDPESHHLLMPLLGPDIMIDVAPVLKAVNGELIACGILPDLGKAFRIRKTNTAQEGSNKKEVRDAALLQQLRDLFSAPAGNTMGGASAVKTEAPGAGFQEHILEAAAASNKLLGYLAGVQKTAANHSTFGGASAAHPHAQSILAHIKAQAPQGAMSRIDEHTIDLLTKIFDVVFRDQHIPQEIKTLIGFLQVPVLKAALTDTEFFFKEEHPARRVIELLSQSGVGWNQGKGEGDPLYQAIKRNVERIQQDLGQDGSIFTDVIADLESFIKEEERQSTEALAVPITQALRQEKIGQATRVARNDVAVRVGTGEVVAFVEAFLEQKWVSVLAIAYSVQEEKPHAAASAVKTMDDLIWSVKPKMTAEARKDLIARLPSMLAALNKWLNIVKWEDADRLQFFADLAECHASIVRAPIDMSPQRQLDIAIAVARDAAERRLKKRAAEQPEPAVDAFVARVQTLERGMWLEFKQDDDSVKRFKLAWISPLRGLFIFSTREKKEAFSLPAAELARMLRQQRVQVIPAGGLVDRALAEAMATAGANDPCMETQSAA